MRGKLRLGHAGELILPQRFRRKIGLHSGDAVEIVAEADQIVIRRHVTSIDQTRQDVCRLLRQGMATTAEMVERRHASQK